MIPEGVCEHCGPSCIPGAAHNARAEDGVIWVPPMTADEAKQKVKNRYPEARTRKWGGWRELESGWVVEVGAISWTTIGSGDTEDEAWIDAASRLPAPIPTPRRCPDGCTFGDGPECLNCANTDRQYARRCPGTLDCLGCSECESRPPEPAGRVHPDLCDVCSKGVLGHRDGRCYPDTFPDEPARFASLPPVQDNVQNLRYATQIAVHLHRVLFPEVTRWQPLRDDLFGVLMQIDNMTCGLTGNAAAPPVEPRWPQAKPMPDVSPSPAAIPCVHCREYVGQHSNNNLRCPGMETTYSADPVWEIERLRITKGKP